MRNRQRSIKGAKRTFLLLITVGAESSDWTHDNDNQALCEFR
jgi:hypothetical protein